MEKEMEEGTVKEKGNGAEQGGLSCEVRNVSVKG